MIDWNHNTWIFI